MTREEAIKYIKSRCIGSNEERDGTQWSEAMWMAIEALSAADRPTGEWIGDKCSICGTERAWYGEQPNYCPDCGAKMRGDDV